MNSSERAYPLSEVGPNVATVSSTLHSGLAYNVYFAPASGSDFPDPNSYL